MKTSRLLSSTIKPALISGFLTCTALANLALAEEKTFKGDRANHDMKEPIAKEDIPPAPILSVEQALSSMQIQTGFVLENIVSEPNTFNPVALSFDAKSRLWICEMTRFMPTIWGEGEEVPEGNIAVLEDTDNDGKIDKRSVFLNDVILPRTISMVEGGIFYADNTQLYFVEVIEKDGSLIPGIREVVDSEYAKGGNVEHKPNGMLYGMDNWYYNVKSNKKYKILNFDAPLPNGAEEIYRNKFWKLVKANSDSRGQWGVSHDDFGRLYHNGNSQPIMGEYLLPGALIKNPGYWPKMQANKIGSTEVFPARINPGVNRAYLESTLRKEGPNKGKLKSFTAASGSVVYRGDQFPAEYYGLGITPEPAGNLISARKIIENEGGLSGEFIFHESELLASTDERFRPVNLYTAPDGSLYILDMYHGIIQHKEFLSSYLGKQIKDRELDKNNNTMGRIYRLRWADNPLGENTQLAQLSDNELVPFLAHDNGWHRDSARRLLVQKQASKSSKAIKKLIKELASGKLELSRREAAIINAVWTLEGLNTLDYSTINMLIKHESAKIRATAVAVSAQLPQKYHERIAKTLLNIAGDDYFVALHIAMIAGDLDSPTALKASQKVLDTFTDKPFVREVVTSGLGEKSEAFKSLIGDHPDEDFRYIMNNLGRKLADRNNRDQLSEQGKALYDQGKALYAGKAACFGCHSADGNGADGMGPTFWDSEWVVESEEKLAKVLLHGLMGPIWVKKRLWQSGMVMPGYANNPSITDEDLAAISTYIRNTWGNHADTGGEVSPELFKKIREQTAGRNTPYKQEDF